MPPTNCPTASQDGEYFDLSKYKNCIELHDTFNLVFDEPGILFYLHQGHFVPEIPTGVFTQGEVPIPFVAVTEGHITIFFTSLKDSKTYVEVLEIRVNCKPVHPKPEDESR